LSEGLEDGEQLLVIDLVVQICWLAAVQVEHDRVNVTNIIGEIWEMIVVIA